MARWFRALDLNSGGLLSGLVANWTASYQLGFLILYVLFPQFFFIIYSPLGHFRITFSLFLKASLGAHPFI